MNNTQFQPVFDHLDKRFQGLAQEIASDIQVPLRELKIAITNLSNDVEKYHRELLLTRRSKMQSSSKQ